MAVSRSADLHLRHFRRSRRFRTVSPLGLYTYSLQMRYASQRALAGATHAAAVCASLACIVTRSKLMAAEGAGDDFAAAPRALVMPDAVAISDRPQLS